MPNPSEYVSFGRDSPKQQHDQREFHHHHNNKPPLRRIPRRTNLTDRERDDNRHNPIVRAWHDRARYFGRASTGTYIDFFSDINPVDE